MKYVVTGGAGFVGSNLVAALVARNDTVIVLDNYRTGHQPGRLVTGASYREIDIVDPACSFTDFQDADVVFHVAAVPRVQYSIKNPGETLQANVVGTQRVLEAARHYKVSRVVFASSSSVYGDGQTPPFSEEGPTCPQSPYGLQKRFGEQLCAMWHAIYGLETVSLRLFNAYGPRMDAAGPYALLMSNFLSQKQKGVPLEIAGDGTHSRDFTHVSDVVRAFLLAAESEHVGGGEIINIGAGRTVSVSYIAGLFGGETIHVEARPEPSCTLADNTKAERLLGWKPSVSIEDGVADLISRYC